MSPYPKAISQSPYWNEDSQPLDIRVNIFTDYGVSG